MTSFLAFSRPPKRRGYDEKAADQIYVSAQRDAAIPRGESVNGKINGHQRQTSGASPPLHSKIDYTHGRRCSDVGNLLIISKDPNLVQLLESSNDNEGARLARLAQYITESHEINPKGILDFHQAINRDHSGLCCLCLYHY